jgi:hypothetical protein
MSRAAAQAIMPGQGNNRLSMESSMSYRLGNVQMLVYFNFEIHYTSHAAAWLVVAQV